MQTPTRYSYFLVEKLEVVSQHDPVLLNSQMCDTFAISVDHKAVVSLLLNHLCNLREILIYDEAALLHFGAELLTRNEVFELLLPLLWVDPEVFLLPHDLLAAAAAIDLLSHKAVWGLLLLMSARLRGLILGVISILNLVVTLV